MPCLSATHGIPSNSSVPRVLPHSLCSDARPDTKGRARHLPASAPHPASRGRQHGTGRGIPDFFSTCLERRSVLLTRGSLGDAPGVRRLCATRDLAQEGSIRALLQRSAQLWSGLAVGGLGSGSASKASRFPGHPRSVVLEQSECVSLLHPRRKDSAASRRARCRLWSWREARRALAATSRPEGVSSRGLLQGGRPSGKHPPRPAGGENCQPATQAS